MECPPTAHVAGPDFSDVAMGRPPGAARLRRQGGTIAEGAGGAHRGRIQEQLGPGLRLRARSIGPSLQLGPANYWSRSPASQASTSRPNRRSRVSGRFASLIQKERILR